MAVFFYHAQPDWASGGFLGVDLFFVLSGYLITTLLIREWDGSGEIDMVGFWARRARRLLPALFLMLAAVLIYAWALGNSTEVERLKGDALATLGYVANWWYIVAGQSYFEQFSRPPMLRHTWSLAIEEQFYLVWPLLIGIGFRAIGSRSKLWLPAILVPTLLSAALMWALLDPAEPSRVYYGTDTRAHVILTGVLMAFVLDRISDRCRPRILDFVGMLSLIAVFGFFVGVNDIDEAMYTGGYLLFAVAAAGAIAPAAMALPGSLLTRLLGAAPLVWLGARSYGIYLWHWPIVILLDSARTGLEASGWQLLAVRLLVTLIVSAVSFRFVEIPIRTGALGSRVQLRLALATGALLIAATLVVTGPLAPQSDGLESMAASLETLPAAETGRMRVLVAGDSVALTLAVHATKHIEHVALRASTVMGCSVVDGDLMTIDKGRLRRAKPCATWREFWASQVDGFQPDVGLLVTGAWNVFDRFVDGEVLRVGTPEHDMLLAKGLQDGIDLLSAQGAAIALTTSPYMIARPDGKLIPWTERNQNERVDAVNAVIRKVARANADRVTLIDLHRFVCPNGVYREEIDGVLLFEDGVHYTKDGALLVWRWLEPQLAAIGDRASR
ncbi:MAG: peptidoglycan/LPS O-acetylase OafA/YrhL [Hyphomicrobiaceae bacterium]|jgi:peptidoglycan/LPS O-acetylase OafA/YrhL